MPTYSKGSLSTDELKDIFGLENGSDVGSGFNAAAGATDGNKTKENSNLGGGYLTNENYNKLKSDSKVKEAYAALHGQEAANKKFKDGSISINTMDALFDDLTAPVEDTPDPTPEPETDDDPIELSPEVLQAKERVAKYEGDILSGETSRRIYGNNQNFLDNYKLNLQNSQKGFMNKYQFDPMSNSAGATDLSPSSTQYEPNTFSGSDISPYDTPKPTELATAAFLKNQKQKTIQDYNIQKVTDLS